MKKRKILLPLIGLIIIALVTSLIFYINKSNKVSYSVPDGYIAIFHGGTGEVVFETYIYKQDNGQANSGFDYINVTKTTTSWGSPDWKAKVTKRGSVQWTDDVFEVAKQNNAYSYVTLPNGDKTYTIERYREMFMMN